MSDSDEIAPIELEQTELDLELRAVAEKAKIFASAAKSEATKKAYRADFEHFSNWCLHHNLSPLPAHPETVAFYITSMADEDYAASTIQRRMVSISQAHKLTDSEPPTSKQVVREVWKGIRREIGVSQTGKRPLLTVEIRRIVQQLNPERLIDQRDAALLLVGFAGGLRRSELVGLDVRVIEERQEGLVLRLRRSKTDQEGEGQQVAIPHGRHEETCPVRALKRWLNLSEVEQGPVFRSVSKGGEVAESSLSGRAVALVVKRHIEAIGLNPDRYGAHSLRSGMATEAARNGASEREIMKQTRHRSVKVVRRYIRDGGIFRGNAAEKLGL
jgi:site-specific recombinase XerD